MYLQEKFGQIEVYIKSKDVDMSTVMAPDDITNSGGFQTETTSGISDKIVSLKEVVREIAKSFGQEMSQLKSDLQSSTVELELTLTLSQGGWIVGLESEQSIKLKIEWKS